MWPLPKPQPPLAAGRTPALRDLHCRPTGLGVGLAVMVGLLWLVGLNYQVNLAYAAAFWLAGFALVAVLMNLRQLLGVQIDVALPQEVFAGGEACLRLSMPDNVRARWLWLCNEDDYLQRPSESALWQPWHAQAFGGEAAFEWRVPAGRRGYLRVPPLRTAAIAPFGLSMVQCVWHWPSDALVYPAPIPHDVPARTAGTDDTDRTWAPLSGGEDLAYLQPHQPGASLQHVAWKSYAKTGEMLDKRFESEPAAVDNTVLSYLDYPPDTPKERLAGLLCHRVLEAERRGLAYSLQLPERVIAPQNGRRERCLSALALW